MRLIKYINAITIYSVRFMLKNPLQDGEEYIILL